MKKNLVLLSILIGLLGLTWMLTESGWFDSRPELETLLKKAITNPQKIELPNALLRVQDGVWMTGAGEVARAEVLDEWHKSMEAIRIARVIKSPPVKKDFFSDGTRFTVDEQVFEFGDLAPSNDSFYLGIPGDPDVYVVDLYDMGSLAVADDEKVLLQAKYQRLRDLLLYPEDRWREQRLLGLVRLSSFEHWEKGELSLDANELSERPWGSRVMQAFLAGLQSLTVKGAIQTEKPAKASKITSWEFILPDDSEIQWEFFEHPSLDLIYVWMPHLGKAYPLDEESSALIKMFPERLIGRMFPMNLNPGSENVTFHAAGKVVKNESSALNAVKRFLQTEQTFQDLTLIREVECKEVEKRSTFIAQIGSLHYSFRRLDRLWTIVDCSTGLQWTWSVPLESDMDFVRLEGK